MAVGGMVLSGMVVGWVVVNGVDVDGLAAPVKKEEVGKVIKHKWNFCSVSYLQIC